MKRGCIKGLVTLNPLHGEGRTVDDVERDLFDTGTADDMVGGEHQPRSDCHPSPGVPAIRSDSADPTHGDGSVPTCSNLTVTSNVAAADARERITPASAVNVTPNGAETSVNCQPSGDRTEPRLPATVVEPAVMAARMFSARSPSC